MKKSRTLFLAVAVFMLALTCGAYVSAEENVYKEDIFTYTVSGGQATITNVDDVRETVVIPEQLDGKKVVALAARRLRRKQDHPRDHAGGHHHHHWQYVLCLQHKHNRRDTAGTAENHRRPRVLPV